MINNIEEIPKFNQERLKYKKSIYSKKKNIRGLSFNEVLSEINDEKRKDSPTRDKSKEGKKNKHEEVKVDDSNGEDMSGIFIDELY